MHLNLHLILIVLRLWVKLEKLHLLKHVISGSSCIVSWRSIVAHGYERVFRFIDIGVILTTHLLKHFEQELDLLLIDPLDSILEHVLSYHLILCHAYSAWTESHETQKIVK